MASVWKGVSSLDFFRRVPRDLTQPTPVGCTFTFVSISIASMLFMLEFNSFMSTDAETLIRMDSNTDSLLRINFDVSFDDLACPFLTVGVFDTFGNDRMNITSSIKKEPIFLEGAIAGMDPLTGFTAPPESWIHEYTESELYELDRRNLTEDEQRELDGSWVSIKDDIGKHENFDDVVEAHDFTFVNFYADWCIHCREFYPTWTKFEEETIKRDQEFLDADGKKVKFRALRINCVEFEEVCRKQSIRFYPTIRLYQRQLEKDGKNRKFTLYHGERTQNGLMEFSLSSVRQENLHIAKDAKFHKIFDMGCRVHGMVEVTRVPGTLHFEAHHTGKLSINTAFTNVSHTVNHLSFGSEDDIRNPEKMVSIHQNKYVDHVAIINKVFATDRFHLAPHHYIKVVSTLFEAENIRSYQISHQNRIANITRLDTPQAKFSYDLAPVEVVVRRRERAFYNFCTSTLAIVGGTFTVMSLFAAFFNIAGDAYKARVGKLL